MSDSHDAVSHEVGSVSPSEAAGTLAPAMTAAPSSGPASALRSGGRPRRSSPYAAPAATPVPYPMSAPAAWVRASRFSPSPSGTAERRARRSATSAGMPLDGRPRSSMSP
ncbi:hypothetical protein SSTG_06050 [Streptomyces sp. e14]|uniref:hypothetical protein n=1 Tax=Streptomyces sp. e14 TaxID=645465 RepID=UPI0001D068FE|nr:hypothetical protein [Streptomyces sp. e14]EFF88401.1 hypothetical protein SSTG_06050 [Streptomyces sp. e14]